MKTVLNWRHLKKYLVSPAYQTGVSVSPVHSSKTLLHLHLNKITVVCKLNNEMLRKTAFCDWYPQGVQAQETHPTLALFIDEAQFHLSVHAISHSNSYLSAGNQMT